MVYKLDNSNIKQIRKFEIRLNRLEFKFEKQKKIGFCVLGNLYIYLS